MKGRTILPFLLLLAAAAAIFLYLRVPRSLTGGRVDATLPLDLKSIIPASWQVLGGDLYDKCDFDGDGENEWFVAYRYDKSTTTDTSLIGAVVFDAQVNRVPQDPGAQSPYRPAFLIPYKLLPDIYGGKGQGYLGESSIKLSYNPPKQGLTCSTKEIVVEGYAAGNASVPVRLSLFRWGGEKVGYAAQHLVGNARIAGSGVLSPTADIHTYNRLNDRSVLCTVQRYTRSSGFEFREDSANATIDFCFGAPNDPAYPEGVVVALLRGKDPDNKEPNCTPSGKTYLSITGGSLPAELGDLGKSGRKEYRIVSVTTPGTVEVNPSRGTPVRDNSCQTGTPSEPQVWWWGAERATVTTEIYLHGQTTGAPRQTIWTLVSLANERLNADVHWRVERVELR